MLVVLFSKERLRGSFTSLRGTTEAYTKALYILPLRRTLRIFEWRVIWRQKRRQGEEGCGVRRKVCFTLWGLGGDHSNEIPLFKCTLTPVVSFSI